VKSRGTGASKRQRGAEQAYKYTSFCVKYRAWAAALKRSMRQTHIAGERLFVDYAGQSVPVIDAATGEVRRARIFVAVLGASNYTYACATSTQNSACQWSSNNPQLWSSNFPHPSTPRSERWKWKFDRPSSR